MRCAALILCCLAVTSAQAQDLRGQISGTVTDRSGQPIASATITLAGSGLIVPRTVTTTDDGRYRILGVSPGDYILTFAAAGFQDQQRPGIRLSLQGALRIDASLAAATPAPDTAVVPMTAAIDTVTTSVGTSFNRRWLSEIPSNRDQWSVLALAPGIQMRTSAVGGVLTGIEQPFAAYGVDAAHRTLVEGIIVNNSRTTNGGFFDFGSLEEVRVSAAAGSLEAPTAGALLTFAVQSGGDRFHGEQWADYDNEHLVTDNRPDFNQPIGDDGLRSDGRLLNAVSDRYDVNGTLGGRIVRGRLWFFTAARETRIGRRRVGLEFADRSRQRNLTGKLTYSVSTGHQLVGYYNWRSKTEPTAGVSPLRPLESSSNQIGRMQLAKIQWTSVLSPRAFFDVQAGLHDVRTMRTAFGHDDESIADVPVGRQDTFTLQMTGGAADYQRTTESRPQLAGGLTLWLWGDQTLKLGVQGSRYRDERHRFVAGDIYYYDDDIGSARFVDIFNTPNTATNEDANVAVYVQDAWALGDRVTLNLGARADRYTLGYPAQSYTPNQAAFFSPVATSRMTVLERTVVSAQTGVTWDLGGNGRTAVKVFGGRAYFDPMTDRIARANPVGTIVRRYELFDANRNRLFDPGESLRLAAIIGVPGAIRVDPNLAVPYADEVSAHVEREVWRGGALRVSYVMKLLRDQDAEVDVARVGLYTVPFTSVDPGPDARIGTGDDQRITVHGLSGFPPSDLVVTTPGGATGTPAFDSDHHSLEAAFMRRFTGRWSLFGSWTGTWSRSFVAEIHNTSADLMIFPAETFRWIPNQRRLGRVDTSVWTARAGGRYEWPSIGVAVAPVLRLHSGYNWARALSASAFSSSGLIPAEEPIRRSPRVSILDVRAEKSFTLGGTHEISAIVDVFNATNAGTVLNFGTVAGTTAFKIATARLAGRTVRFAARYAF